MRKFALLLGSVFAFASNRRSSIVKNMGGMIILKDILHKLYFGQVSRWECRANRSVEENNIENKIKSEKKYFKETLSDEDYKRLNELESFQSDIRGFEDMRTFNYAFRMGAMLMCAVFFGEEAENDS